VEAGRIHKRGFEILGRVDGSKWGREEFYPS